MRFVQPPDERGWRDSWGAQIERTDIENLVTRTALVAWRRQSVEERRQIAFGAAYYLDQQHPQDGDDVDAHALQAQLPVTIRFSHHFTDALVAPVPA